MKYHSLIVLLAFHSVSSVNGTWSGWSRWGSCSETCGVGIRLKTRICANSNSLILGKRCNGTSVEVGLCNKHACPDNMIAFTAYGKASGTNKKIVFPNVLLNYGGGYNNTTGIFTSSTPGIYHFAVSLIKKYNMKDSVLRCYLNINNSKKLNIDGRKVIDNEMMEFSATASVHLNKSDIVYILDDLFVLLDANNDKSSSFTGALVTPDI
ncbi:semaphorin-5A-like isoform X2 [Mercenaria mercenaria]|uniref:semaphorin-5A-like isoform X2 n=1 Tax=Mercenaria mercenaria TaxID=6596 RepID=UPI00234E385A|nr:semaphorin-5A-like isoform X2 [Mercenaria mercenaria]